MGDLEYGLSNRRLPGPVFRIVAGCPVSDIPEVIRFSILGVAVGI